MSYFAPMSSSDIWRAKALIAQYPKRSPYNEGLPTYQTMEARYDQDFPSQTAPLSANDTWRARALIAEFPAQKLSSETQPAPKESLKDYFKSFDEPIFPPPELDKGPQEGTPIDGPIPTFQRPGEIQGPNMDDLYGRLAEARANYQWSRSGLERAGNYAVESANDFVRSMANAATFNSADKIAAALDSAFINDDDYETNLARQRAETGAAQERSPVATRIGEKAGDRARNRLIPKVARAIWERIPRR